MVRLLWILAPLFSLQFGGDAWAHASLGAGFQRPRSALERAAHTQALVVARVSRETQPRALSGHVPPSSLVFQAEIIRILAGSIHKTQVEVMQQGRKQLSYPTGSLILLSLNSTAKFVSANIPRPPELVPHPQAPAWFTEQTRAETVEIQARDIEPLSDYLERLLPFEQNDDPLIRTAGIFDTCFRLLETQRLPPPVAFELVKDLLIASLDVKPTIEKAVARNLMHLITTAEYDFRTRHGALILLLKADPSVWRPAIHELLKTPGEERLQGLGASQLARNPAPVDAPLLLELLGSSHIHLVRAAVIGLGKLANEHALSQFETLLLSANEELISTIVSAAAMMNTHAGSTSLKDWSQNHPDPRVKAAASRQLIRSGN